MPSHRLDNELFSISYPVFLLTKPYHKGQAGKSIVTFMLRSNIGQLKLVSSVGRADDVEKHPHLSHRGR